MDSESSALPISWAWLEALASFPIVPSPPQARDRAGGRQGLSWMQEAAGDTTGATGAGWQIFKLKYIYTLDK